MINFGLMFLDIQPEVENALAQSKPVVALESTIIAHGMPYPQNVETAIKVENTIREHGAIPASIAILDGRLKAGLSPEQINLLGKAGSDVPKVSRRDLPYIVAEKKHGATTVASTMIIAEQAGIKLFATGGIGGVHRGAEVTMDISADLEELAKTNVAVVSAGAKAILDLGLTLEYLETKGVPVLGFNTDELPAFYSRSSGLKLVHNIKTPEAIAQVLNAKWKLGLDGGVLIANPIPQEFEIEYEAVNQAVDQAIMDANALGIKGKEITPYLLNRIKELTSGKSLDANIKLVLNNAKLAAEIACAYADIV